MPFEFNVICLARNIQHILFLGERVNLKKLISIIIIFAVFLAVLTFGGFTANAGAPYKEASS